jgi:UDP-3-O-[3-hydroxymyristoyl] N-acetylglucosamine deacetylase
VRQHTIAEKISCTGIGLHSGAPVQLTLRPAHANTGVVFVRTDLEPQVEIPARSASLAPAQNATTLRRDGAHVATVEHLLSALYGLGIDNVLVEVDGPEVPVMDGSAASFAYLVRAAGVFRQHESRCTVRIRKKIEVCDGDRRMSVEPASGFRVDYGIFFDHPAIGHQALELDALDAESFEREIAGARTFGFLREVEALRHRGLALGGSLDNALVLDDEAVLNSGGLRWPDEFVRHKVLDLLGDLALLGAPLIGHIRVERGGHSLHHRLVAAILDNPKCWQVDHAECAISDALGLTSFAEA